MKTPWHAGLLEQPHNCVVPISWDLILEEIIDTIIIIENFFIQSFYSIFFLQ